MLKTSKSSNFYERNSVLSIRGCVKYDTINPFNVPVGQLVFNKNMEYKFKNNGIYLETRYGSSLTKDTTYKALGMSTYKKNSTDNYIVFFDNRGILKYLDDDNTIIDIKSGLGSVYNNFSMFGSENLSALYGCNTVDGVYKIDGEFVFGSIADSPNLVDMVYSSASGRMIGANDQTVRWTEIQQLDADALTNIETWNVDTNFARPTPDNGKGVCAVRDDGQVTYFFKDTGILALPNASEDVVNWYFPKLKASVGTISGRTVRYVKYGSVNGFIYLATDKTLRFIPPRVEFNAGVLPTIFDDTAHIISLNFQSYLDDINNLEECSAYYYDNKYILNIPINSGSLNKTIVIDCEKLLMADNNQYSQPYWYEADSLDFNNFTVKDNDLYGTNIKGYISKIFDKTKLLDEVPTRINDNGYNKIDIKVIFGWMNFGINSVEIPILYLNWATDLNASIKMFMNSFSVGDALPQYDNDDNSETIYPNTNSGGYAGQILGGLGLPYGLASTLRNEMTTPVRLKGSGNYFNFGIYDNNLNRKTIIYGLIPMVASKRKNKINRR